MRPQTWHENARKLRIKEGYSGRKIAKILGVSKTQVNEYFRITSGGYEEVEEADNSPKILFLDIETRQMLLGGFGLFNQNFSVDQIEEDWSIISFSASWGDPNDVMYYDVVTNTEDEILQKLHDLFSEADFVCGHNMRRFDVKKIRTRMIIAGYKPHSPIRVIDTLEIAKKEFGFTSNKLIYLTRVLCKKNIKSDHGKFAGYLLWKEFMKGNIEAINEMREYNIIDVTSLIELYNILAPWSTRLPNFEVYKEEPSLADWEKDGYIYSNMGKYDRYINKHSGQFMRGRKNLLSKEFRDKLLSNIV